MKGRASERERGTLRERRSRRNGSQRRTSVEAGEEGREERRRKKDDVAPAVVKEDSAKRQGAAKVAVRAADLRIAAGECEEALALLGRKRERHRGKRGAVPAEKRASEGEDRLIDGGG